MYLIVKLILVLIYMFSVIAYAETSIIFPRQLEVTWNYNNK